MSNLDSKLVSSCKQFPAAMKPAGVERHRRSPRGERTNRSPSNLSKAGWSLGRVSAIDSNGRTIWIADAHRDDGKRYVVRADELLTALELRSTPAGGLQARIVKKRFPAGPRCSTQRARTAPPHAEGDELSGVTSDRETFAFISAPAGVVGGVPLTRARNPWAMPAAST